MSAVPYRVRRSARARRARIQVSADGVEVVVPRGVSLAEVEPFVEGKRPWIESTLRRMAEAQAERPAPALHHGGHVPYLGERLALHVEFEPGRTRAHVRRGGANLCVVLAPPAAGATPRSGAQETPRVGANPPAGDQAEPLRSALERWYRRRARDEVGRRLDAAVARAGTSYSRLQIRGQRTRWASCSTTGAMSFNWRLLLAPAEILDYVVEHEVAHLEVHDHSERFWALLTARWPECRRHEAWLRRHGQGLHL